VPYADAIFLTTALLLGGWVIWYDHAVEGRPEDTWQGWCALKIPPAAAAQISALAHI
jgi:hypothetical protein